MHYVENQTENDRKFVKTGVKRFFNCRVKAGRKVQSNLVSFQICHFISGIVASYKIWLQNVP